MINSAESDFAKLLSRATSQISEKSTESNLAELKSTYEKTSSLIEKVKLEEQITRVEQQQVVEELQKNPKILDDLMKKETKMSADREPVQIGDPNRNIRLSQTKTEQILKNGESELEALTLNISKGDQVGIKSSSFGELFGKIIRSDPEHPDHILVETMQSGQLRTLSIPQTELMLSDKEKSQFLSEMMMKPSNNFKKLLERIPSQEDRVKVLVDEIVKQAMISPQAVRINELEQKLADLDRHPSGLMSDQRKKLANELRDLTNMSSEDRHVMKALRLMDVNLTQPPKEYPEIIAKAKKIMLSYDQTQLSGNDKGLVNFDLASLEKKLVEAPRRAISSNAKKLREINGSQSFGRINNFPSRTDLAEKLKLQNLDQNTYRAVEQLFKENPELLSGESRDWLNKTGRGLLMELEKKNVDSNEGRTFLKRLEIYINIDQLKNL
jgi:hypothetical protein